jgi:hypothetical protein
MKKGSLSDKERKLVAAARQEAEAKRAGAAPRPAMKAAPVRAPTSPLDGRTVIGWDHPAAHVTPLDQPTVAGWDHPAASARGQDADGKWSRIAALMESERAAATRKRQRAKRRAAIFLGVLLVIATLVAARVLLTR